MALSTVARADTLVVPNGLANSPGNFPFKLGGSSIRIQEVIGSAQFPGPITITAIRVRAATGTGAAHFSLSSLKITLSTTQAYPNTGNGHALPSATYANNIGPDATVVFNGPYTGSSSGCGLPGPCPLDIVIQFAIPFTFDPSKGRLLIDETVSPTVASPVGNLDGVSFQDPATSPVAGVASDPSQASGTVATVGFVFGLDAGTSVIITSVQNAASNIGFNAPIAQGSIFTIKGSGLGPGNISIASAPFQSTMLNGTSVDVTVGATTVHALMYYTSANQVAALLPSNTPTGNATFTVSYNNQVSNGMSQTVVSSNVGLFTIDSSGEGPAIATYADYGLVSAAKASNCGGPNTACGAANPGDTLSLWATGLGPVNGDDSAGVGLGQNMPNVPLTLWLGGVKTSVIYQGRSGYVGLDQIVFTLPDNVPTGCAVPLVVQIGTVDNTVSNSTVIPIAAKGIRDCTPTNAALVSANVEQLIMGGGPVSYGQIGLSKFLNANGKGYEDEADFQFSKILGITPGFQPFLASYIDDPPSGTCIVYSHFSGQLTPPITNSAPADAGSSFTVKGPSGTLTIQGKSGSFTGSLSASGTFLLPGAYAVTGSGGVDIGPINASITIPPAVTVTNLINNATRSNAVTMAWSGGDPNGNVLIRIYSATDNTYTTGAKARCTAPASAGKFIVPPYILLPLPAGNFAGFTIAPDRSAVAFSATGLSFGAIQINFDGTGVGYGAGFGNFVLK